MTTAATTAPIELDEPLKARIRHLASERKTSPSLLVEKALEFLEREGDEEEAYCQRARQALANYRKTGLHITGEELFAWMDRLDSDPKAPLPPCHI